MFPIRIFEYPAKILLYLFGWKQVSTFEILSAKMSTKTIVLFSHSSLFDFWFLLLYCLSNFEILKDTYIVMKPQPFENPLFAKFLYLIHCIPATKLEERGKGFVNETVEFMRNREKCYLIISPQGRMLPGPWKSGYYYIGKEVNADFRIIGLDYEKKEPFIDPHSYRIEYFEDKDSLEKKLKERMGLIVPLHTKDSYIRIRDHNEDEISSFDLIFISTWISLLIGSYFMFSYGSYLLCLHTIIGGSFSIFYHQGHESCPSFARKNFWSNIIFIVHYFSYLVYHNLFFMDLILFSLISFTILVYLSASGRQEAGKRTKKYIKNHSLFHILASITISYPLIKIYCV